MPDVTPGPVGFELADFPVGAVLPWAASTAPVGWLMLDGSVTISQATHPALFAVWADNALPDLRARVPMGGTTSIGSTGGAETVTLTPSQMGIPGHTHTYSDRYPGSTNLVNSGSTDSSLNGATTRTLGSGGVTEANASSAHNNMQPYITLNFIVKAY